MRTLFRPYFVEKLRKVAFFASSGRKIGLAKKELIYDQELPRIINFLQIGRVVTTKILDWTGMCPVELSLDGLERGRDSLNKIDDFKILTDYFKRLKMDYYLVS